MDENKKREGLGLGARKQLITPCTGDVRTVGAPFRSTFALGSRGQSNATITNVDTAIADPQFLQALATTVL